MPRFAANLTMMFNEWPFLDRFEAAAEAGFEAVEFQFPYDFDPEIIADRLQRHGLTQALFNLPPGNWAAGERGLAAIPGRFDDLKAGVERAAVYTEATGAKRVHLMSGIASRHDPEAEKSYRRAVIHTAERLGEQGVDVLLEPINARNMPGYYLNDFAYAEALIADLKLPNVKLQFDMYHRQILHGDVIMAFRAMQPIVGHVQIASVPSRHEPDGEELNYPYLFGELDRLGYNGFVGCEYIPRSGTLAGLGWFRLHARS